MAPPYLDKAQAQFNLRLPASLISVTPPSVLTCTGAACILPQCELSLFAHSPPYLGPHLFPVQLPDSLSFHTQLCITSSGLLAPALI